MRALKKKAWLCLFSMLGEVRMLGPRRRSMVLVPCRKWASQLTPVESRISYARSVHKISTHGMGCVAGYRGLDVLRIPRGGVWPRVRMDRARLILIRAWFAGSGRSGSRLVAQRDHLSPVNEKYCG